MTDVRYAEFLAELENTRYPFTAAASLTNRKVILLEGTFLDAHIYAAAGGSRYYLAQIKVTATQIEFTVGNFTDKAVATGVIPLPVQQNSVRLVDTLGRPAGILVSEPARLASVIAWGTGTQIFELEQTEFCVSCQMPVAPIGVTGFQLPDGQILSGKVWLVGEEGVIIQKVDVLNRQGETVSLIQPSVVGDPLFRQRSCNDNGQYVPQIPVQSIVAVNENDEDYEYPLTPDTYGNISINMYDGYAEKAALRIRTSTAGVYFEVAGTPVTE
jgi:hypothetical protein